MLSRPGETENCQIVGFGAAAGEDDLGSAASQQSGDRLSCAFHRRPRLLSMMMDGRRVAEVLPEVALHGLKDRGQHRGGGVIVEIDAAHGYCHFTLYMGAGTGRRLALPNGYIPLRIRRSNVVGAGADQAVVVELLDDMGGPAADTRHGKYRGE